MQTTRTTADSPWPWYALTGFVILVNIAWNAYFRAEAPVGDDIGAIFKQIVSFHEQGDPFSKFEALTEQNAEHRLLFTRMLALLSQQVFGYVSIKMLYIAGCLQMPAILLIIVRSVKTDPKTKGLFILLFSLLILVPVYDSVGAVENGYYSSILLGLIAILLLERKGVFGFILFQLFSFLAMFTQGNGLLVAPLGLIYFVFFDRKRNTIKIISHGVLSAAFLCLFFYNFTDEGGVRAATNHYLLDHPFYCIFHATLIFFIWLGQWAVLFVDYPISQLAYALAIAFVTGLVLLSCFLGYVYRYRNSIGREHILPGLMLSYLALTLLGGSWGRSLVYSWYTDTLLDIPALNFVMSTRYSFFPICVLAMMVAIILDLVRREKKSAFKPLAGRYATILIVLASLLAGNRYHYTWPYITKQRNDIGRCIKLWNEKHEAKPCRWHGDNGSVLRAAEADGIVRFEN